MDAANLLEGIEELKQHGDAPRIAKIVNEDREKKGLCKFSAAYIRSMLNGNRKITEDVAGIVLKYYEVQKQLNL